MPLTLTMTHTRQSYRRQLVRELGVLLDLMQKTWDYRPTLTVGVAEALIVQTDFNMQGFAHNGRRLYVHGDSESDRRSPARVAREIAAEISGHRNTCEECGIGVAPIYCRAHGLQYLPGLDLAVPPDAVERVLHPVFSRRLDERLAEEAGAGGR